MRAADAGAHLRSLGRATQNQKVDMMCSTSNRVKEQALVDLKEQGIALIPGVLSKAECQRYIDNLEDILATRIRDGVFCGNERYQVLYNYFQGHPENFGLVYQELTDQIMSEVIDQDYVLISPSARNRQIRKDMGPGRPTSGVGWHFDTRQIGRVPQALRPSPIFFSIVALDDLSEENGATFYIPKSHLWYRRPNDRNAKLESLVLKAKAGSVVCFDAALWHRVGEPSERSRWAIFNMFGPWFMKPYFRFQEMFSPAEMESFPPKIRQLLHWDSLPPRDHTESTVTLRRVREQVGAMPVE